MFEDLIPFIIFLIFVLPAILKKFIKPAKGKKQAEKKSVLGKFFQQIRNEIEKSKQAGKTRTPSKILLETPEEDEYFDDIAPAPKAETKRVAAAMKPVEARETKSVRKAGVARPKYTRASLRRAVIWSEILGKPIALREP